MGMSRERREQGLAQVRAIRRRLADRDFSDVPDIPDDDTPLGDVVPIDDRPAPDPRHPSAHRLPYRDN